jgi:hypothetical protein
MGVMMKKSEGGEVAQPLTVAISNAQIGALANPVNFTSFLTFLL